MRFTLILLMNLLFVSLAKAAPLAKERAIHDLQELKSQNTKRLEELDARLKTLMSPQTLTLSFNEGEIEKMDQDRRDLLLRQQVLDRILFQVDARFTEGDLREFLVVRLADMARVDLLNNTDQQKLWKQLSYLSQALRDLPERGDNVIAFIDGYLSRSSFREPLRPEEYLRTRQYSNGRDVVAAAPVSQDQVGDLVEKRLKALEDSPTSDLQNSKR